jgi:hypothetical protein
VPTGRSTSSDGSRRRTIRPRQIRPRSLQAPESRAQGWSRAM